MRARFPLPRLVLLACLAVGAAACESAPRRGAVLHADLPLGPWWGFRGPYEGPIALGEPRPPGGTRPPERARPRPGGGQRS